MIRPVPKSWAAQGLTGAAALFWILAFGLAPSPLMATAHPGAAHVASYILTLAGMLCFFLALGQGVQNSPYGIILTGRNTYSLARLQMVLWTIVILSAIMAAAACRSWNGAEGLGLNIPSELFMAMGISFVSAASAPAILSLKTQTEATQNQIASASRRMGELVSPAGQIVGRPSGATASLADLVKGDDLATAGTVDLSKVQQLLISLMLVGIYAVSLASLFYCAQFGEARTQFPEFSQDFVNLLLVSHGGYLAYKATSKPVPEGADAGARPPSPDRGGEPVSGSIKP